MKRLRAVSKVSYAVLAHRATPRSSRQLSTALKHTAPISTLTPHFTTPIKRLQQQSTPFTSIRRASSIATDERKVSGQGHS
jgi:hypothetical protein